MGVAPATSGMRRPVFRSALTLNFPDPGAEFAVIPGKPCNGCPNFSNFSVTLFISRGPSLLSLQQPSDEDKRQYR